MGQIIYKWKIHPELSVIYNEQSLQNVVNKVRWVYQADYILDGQTTSSATKILNGTTELEPPTVNTFVPYENITEQLVTDWVVSVVGLSKITEMQQILSASISTQISSITGTLEAPWA